MMRYRYYRPPSSHVPKLVVALIIGCWLAYLSGRVHTTNNYNPDGHMFIAEPDSAADTTPPGLSRAATGDSCTAEFLQGQRPTLLNPSMNAETHQLCFDAYSALYSGVSRTPLWSAEHLTRSAVLQAQTLERVNDFHEETSLPVGIRSTLRDYVHSGYDRGHMSPSGDFATPAAQDQSFSLANMVPQNPNLNRQLWEQIESSVRRIAKKDGEIYVVTGPIFRSDQLSKVGNVLVPTDVYKAVYSPKQHAAAVFIAENIATHQYQLLSLSQGEAVAGINFFPALSNPAIIGLLNPPAIKERGHHYD